MNTCFLFTKYLDENGCYCFKLATNGTILTPPAQRTFTEIRALQQDCTTIIVETTESCSLLSIELPWLPERKARLAIPYALEDKLAQSVEELHFAFDKLRYHNHHYLVIVLSKQRILHLMQLLSEHQIEFDIITIDWFALEPQQLCISGSTLLIHNEEFKGALSGDLALAFLKKHPLDELFLFQDSQIISDPSLPKNEVDSRIWIGQKILKSKPLNLCQGKMQHGNEESWIKKGYILVGMLACFWLLSLLLTNIWSLYSLNQQNAKIEQQIALIYHEFFPEAKQVISPKFRISQLLGNDTTSNQAHFWLLLDKLAKVMTNTSITIEQLRYQNKNLSVTVVSPDFASLEHLQNQLKQLNLTVNQTQASTRDQHVIATLELM